jgi:HTH-type transcriptional regulator/antitoxin HipB
MITIIFIATMKTIDYIRRKTAIVMEIRRPAELGAYIMSVRRARGLNQQELAARLGVSRIWIGQIERGKASPRLDLILRTLNELEITLSVSTTDEVPAQTHGATSRGPEPIDIDEIAQTGLTTARPAPAPRKRRRR